MVNKTTPETPTIELEQVASKEPTRLITIKGRLYWATIVSGNQQHSHLHKSQWDQLVPRIQRTWLAYIDAQSAKKTLSIREEQPEEIEISLSPNQESIHYTNGGARHAINNKDLELLKSHQGHNLLQELRHAFRGQPLPPYFSREKEQQRNHRLTVLSTEYQKQYRHIHALHTHMDKDLPIESFEFYVEQITHSRCNTFPVSYTKELDLKHLNKQPLFIPLKVHPSLKKDKKGNPILSKTSHLLGLFINNHEIVIYNPIAGQTKISQYPELETILSALLKEDPHLKILYKNAHNITPAQEKRSLLLFLDSMLSTECIEDCTRSEQLQNLVRRRTEILYARFTKNLEKSFDGQCYDLAQKTERPINSIYEQAAVMGT